MTVLELSRVTKRFGDFTAVADVSLTVDKGQILSLLGPSGCGKTTTLRMVSGFEEPNAGSIFIAGQDMKGKRPYERNVGLLFQDYALFPHMTVVQNVGYGLKNRGYEKRRIPIAHLGAVIHLVIELEGGRRITATEQYLGQPLEQTGKSIDLVFRPGDCIIVPADS